MGWRSAFVAIVVAPALVVRAARQRPFDMVDPIFTFGFGLTYKR